MSKYRPPAISETTFRHWVAHKQTVKMLVRRDGNLCALCGESMSASDMTIDHIVPQSAGGRDHITNFRLAHERCNRYRGATVYGPVQE